MLLCAADASGFADVGSPGSPGEVGVLGMVTFGTSPTATLTMTVAGGKQASCTVTATPSYKSSTSTMELESLATSPTAPPSSGGNLNFVLEILNPSGKWADALESDNSLPGVSICGESISSTVLKGHLKLISQGWDH